MQLSLPVQSSLKEKIVIKNFEFVDILSHLAGRHPIGGCNFDIKQVM